MPRPVSISEEDVPKFHKKWKEFAKVFPKKMDLYEALAEHFGVSVRTVQYAMKSYPLPAPKPYERAEKFLKIAHIYKWFNKMKTKHAPAIKTEEKRRGRKLKDEELLKIRNATGLRYIRDCQKIWEEFMDRLDPMLWTPEDIARIKSEYMIATKHYKPNTIENKIVSIRRMMDAIGRSEATEWEELSTEELGEETWTEPLRIEEFKTLVDEALPEVIADPLELEEAQMICYLKASTGMRTGDPYTGKDIFGLKMGKWQVSSTKGVIDASYIIVDSAYSQILDFQVLSKRNLQWKITYMYLEIRKMFLDYLKKRGKREGDYVFTIDSLPMLKYMKKAYKIVIEKHPRLKPFEDELGLHTLRATFLTWLVEADCPLELAIKINEGWKDANTARDHYLRVKGAKYDQAWGKVENYAWKQIL